jgi:hypothetical protein
VSATGICRCLLPSQQNLEDRLALARAGVIAAYEDYLEAKATAPDTALHEAEKRLQEIETRVDAIAAETGRMKKVRN